MMMATHPPRRRLSQLALHTRHGQGLTVPVASAGLQLWPSASATCAAIRSGRAKPSAVLEAHIARVEADDLNAVVVRDFERARALAQQADVAAAAGKWWGPLHGLPMTVKDNLDVAGLPTSRGDPALASGAAASASDAGVALLQSAGAIIFGKTNLPLNGNDVQSYNKAFGTTLNPHDHSRTPGGSSVGATVACVFLPCAPAAGSLCILPGSNCTRHREGLPPPSLPALPPAASALTSGAASDSPPTAAAYSDTSPHTAWCPSVGATAPPPTQPTSG